MRVLGTEIEALRLWSPDDIIPNQQVLNMPKVSSKAQSPQASSLPISSISPHSSFSHKLQSFESENLNETPQSTHIHEYTRQAKFPNEGNQPLQPHKHSFYHPTAASSGIKQQIRHVMETLDAEELADNRISSLNHSPIAHESTGDNHMLQRNYTSVLGMLQVWVSSFFVSLHMYSKNNNSRSNFPCAQLQLKKE